MAVGLPCVSTPVGGIPELLPKELMIEPDDYKKFAETIANLINNPSKLEELSKNNIEIAKQYMDERLTKKRNDFYNKLKKITINNNKSMKKVIK